MFCDRKHLELILNNSGEECSVSYEKIYKGYSFDKYAQHAIKNPGIFSGRSDDLESRGNACGLIGQCRTWINSGNNL